MSLIALVNSGCPRLSHEHRKKFVDEPEQRKCFLCEPTIKFTFNPLGLCDKIKEIIIPNSKTEFRFLFHMIFSNEDSIYYLPLELELIIFNFIHIGCDFITAYGRFSTRTYIICFRRFGLGKCWSNTDIVIF